MIRVRQFSSLAPCLVLLLTLCPLESLAQNAPAASEATSDVAPASIDDRDQDGVLDVIDRCPDQPEVYNGFEDDDGCPDTVPDPGHLEGTISAQIPLVGRQLQVVSDAARIIDMVAALLREHPGIAQLTIEAHTDARDADAWNLRLSQARADYVMRELVRRGAAPVRLVAIGYGEQCPRVPGVGAAVWARNRRITFVVTRSSDPLFHAHPTGCPAARAP